jgi:flagellar biogenesis protein FliO
MDPKTPTFDMTHVAVRIVIILVLALGFAYIAALLVTRVLQCMRREKKETKELQEIKTVTYVQTTNPDQSVAVAIRA